MRATAQVGTLPLIDVNRRADITYLDSLSNVFKQQQYRVARLPRTPAHDTLVLKAAYQLCRLHEIWGGRRDSTRHYANALMREARQRKNPYYEANGKLLLAEYCRTADRNTPEALRLGLNILSNLPNEYAYLNLRFRSNQLLGSLYGVSGQYQKALFYMQQARQVILSDTLTGASLHYSRLINLEQRIAELYNRQNNPTASEKHYLLAEALLPHINVKAANGYIYSDLGEFYLKYRNPQRALHYAKKAEAIWEGIRPANESKEWGSLACIHAQLNQPKLARHYADKILAVRSTNRFLLEQAYTALYQAAEQEHNWQQAIGYYKHLMAFRDSIRTNERAIELVSVEKQAAYDRLVGEQEQAQALQAQRLLTVQKQADFDRLLARTQTESLLRQNQLTQQQRQLDNQRAQLRLNRQQAEQNQQRQQFRVERTEQQALLAREHALVQRNRAIYVGCILALLVVLLTLLSWSLRYRYRQKIRQLQVRERIARDLHDDMGSHLSSISVLSSAARLSLGTSPDKAQASLESIGRIARQTLDTMSDLVWSVNPANDTMPHVLNRMADVGNALMADGTIQFTFSADEAANHFVLTGEGRRDLYLIYKESLTNAVRYAHATQIKATVHCNAAGLTLTIHDNGCGFDPAQPVARPGGGNGLRNLHHRADLLGGQLTILSAPGKGTQVTLVVKG
jgi:signal transduction histidine kinase